MSSANFGQNEWLVDLMYQQYKEDPKSVDAEWRDYFENNSSPVNAPGNTQATAGNGAQKTTGSQGATKNTVTPTRDTTAGGKQPKGSASQNQDSNVKPTPKRTAPPAPKQPVEAPEPGKTTIRVPPRP